LDYSGDIWNSWRLFGVTVSTRYDTLLICHCKGGHVTSLVIFALGIHIFPRFRNFLIDINYPHFRLTFFTSNIGDNCVRTRMVLSCAATHNKASYIVRKFSS